MVSLGPVASALLRPAAAAAPQLLLWLLLPAAASYLLGPLAGPILLGLTPRSLGAQASLVACAVSGLTFCLCAATGSLLAACCGNDKPSTVPPSVTSGRKRSVALLVLAVALSLAFQYGVGPAMLTAPVGGYLRAAWTGHCAQYDYDAALEAVCAGNMGVYRVGFATALFFALAALGACCRPTLNREAWPAKCVLYLCLVAATVFIPNQPLFSGVYLNLARIGGVLFIFLQQLIIVDCAHNWNDAWVARADKAEAEEAGAGRKWLGAILCSCAILFAAAIVGIALLFVHFTGCRTNTAFIASTLCLCVLITAAQLSGVEGSLLSSASVSAWAVYLLYSAVAKNPDDACNPLLGQPDRLSIALGLVITMISLGWTGWSYTAEDKLTETRTASSEDTPTTAADETTGDKPKPKVTGVVTGEPTLGDSETGGDGKAAPDAVEPEYSKPSLSNSWRLSAILAVVTGWTSMILTRWGAISTDGSAANPAVGTVAMWMLMASQWVALLLYLWTLVAPRLFPDRDFS